MYLASCFRRRCFSKRAFFSTGVSSDLSHIGRWSMLPYAHAQGDPHVQSEPLPIALRG